MRFTPPGQSAVTTSLLYTIYRYGCYSCRPGHGNSPAGPEGVLSGKKQYAHGLIRASFRHPATEAAVIHAGGAKAPSSGRLCCKGRYEKGTRGRDEGSGPGDGRLFGRLPAGRRAGSGCIAPGAAPGHKQPQCFSRAGRGHRNKPPAHDGSGAGRATGRTAGGHGRRWRPWPAER